MERRLPADRYSARTTEASKALARGLEKLGVVPEGPIPQRFASPMGMDYIVRNWTGSLGEGILSLTSKGLQRAGVLPESNRPTDLIQDSAWMHAFVHRLGTHGSKSIDDFYKRITIAEQRYNSLKQRLSEGTPSQKEFAQGLIDEHIITKSTRPQRAMANMSKAIRNILDNPNYDPVSKRIEADGIYFQMIKMAMEFNEIMDRAERDHKQQMRNSNVNTH
jgi:hypothetical protein